MTEAKDQKVVVIGAGQAGFEVCNKLRSLGHEGPITLIGEEKNPPYQRPPLSKAYLLGKMELERLYFRPLDFFETNGIEIKTSTSCVSVDTEACVVRLSDGETLSYDALVLTTGSSPIRLPETIGGELNGVHYVRDLEDADAMAEDMQPGKRVLIVGGGYVGLEAAAVASGLGLKVDLVEAGERILQRVACDKTSDYFRELHQKHGVKLLEGKKLDRLTGEDGVVKGAVLEDGSELEVDLVVIGVGIRPNVKLAEDAGLTIENGIKVDEYCRTSDPKIYAAGDCASFPYHNGRIRLESVGNAIDQAQAVAANIMGTPTSYTAKPWFWSDQYDVKLQIAGLSTGFDDVFVRGAEEAARSHWYFRDGSLIAVDALNDPRAYMVGKRLIEAGKSPDPSQLVDPKTELAGLLKQ